MHARCAGLGVQYTSTYLSSYIQCLHHLDYGDMNGVIFKLVKNLMFTRTAGVFVHDAVFRLRIYSPRVVDCGYNCVYNCVWRVVF